MFKKKVIKIVDRKYYRVWKCYIEFDIFKKIADFIEKLRNEWRKYVSKNKRNRW